MENDVCRFAGGDLDGATRCARRSGSDGSLSMRILDRMEQRLPT